MWVEIRAWAPGSVPSSEGIEHPLQAQAGGYRLFFYVEPYLGADCFFPEITVAFHVRDPERDYHVPLLLSRYGYTTYRGS